MKLKKLLSALVSTALILPVIATAGAIGASAEDDYILTDTDVQADKAWGQALTLQTPELDSSILKEGCTVVVEYENGAIEFVCQSWNNPDIEGCDKEIWAKVPATSDENGVATYSYDNIKKAFIDDGGAASWDCLMAIHVGVTDSVDTVVHKAYITYGDSSEPAAEPEKEPVKEPEKVEETTDKNPPSGSDVPEAPTISFDMSDWSKYIHLSPDAGIAGIKVDTTRKGQYQGATMVLSVDMKSDLSGKYPTFAEGYKDDDGNLVYPDASEEKENLVKMGFELKAADFGLETFDGATVTFKYAFNEDAANILLGGCIYMYATNEEYEVLTNNAMQLKVNTITKENINYYSNGFVTVPTEAGATSILFEVPLLKGYTGDLIMIDNLSIEIGGKKITNVDGYNDTAKPMKENDGVLKIEGSGNKDTSSSSEAPKEEGGKFNPIIIVVILLVIAAIVLVVVLILKSKNRYY